MTPILTLDTEHYKHTLTYTLYNRAYDLSFTFDDAERCRLFAAAWYENHINARFAYEMSLMPKLDYAQLPGSVVEMMANHVRHNLPCGITDIWELDHAG